MYDLIAWVELTSVMQALGSLCQIVTAAIAVGIAIVTYRYTKRQNALSLINQNNTLANAVNATIIQSPRAREVIGRLSDPIVGKEDDPVIFMYLNYVHNTFRTFQIGAISAAVWSDTLASCVAHLTRLERHQVQLLLGRGYERTFCDQVLAGVMQSQATVKAQALAKAQADVPVNRPGLRLAA